MDGLAAVFVSPVRQGCHVCRNAMVSVRQFSCHGMHESCPMLFIHWIANDGQISQNILNVPKRIVQ